MSWLEALLEVIGVHQERSFRVPCSLPVQAWGPQSGPVGGKAVNLSHVGLMLRLHQPLIANEEVTVHLFGRAAPHSSISLQARVIWTRTSGRTVDTGLEVIGFGETPYENIVHFFRQEVRLEVHSTASRLRSPRVVRSYPLVFTTLGPGRPVEGELQNLSVTGVRFFCSRPADPGEWLELSLELPHSQQSIKVQACVRRCRKVDDDRWDIAAAIRPDGRHNRELLRAELAGRAED